MNTTPKISRSKRIVVSRDFPTCNTSRLCRISWRETARQITVSIEDTFVDISRISPMPSGLCAHSARAYGADSPDWRAWAASVIFNAEWGDASAIADAPQALLDWAEDIYTQGAPS